MDTLLIDRRNSCSGRIDLLRSSLQQGVEMPSLRSLAVYVTGSYGRMEASKFSDLDLFFVDLSRSGVSYVDKALLDAELIKSCRKLKFPEFTKGGIYLQIHKLTNILESLGTPSDDYKNYFTARMLLLLESKCVLNERNYSKAISGVVQSYYRDFHEHETDFQPIFLVNDIVRFWKTMCLNYESNRNRKTSDPYKKNKIHLKNIKLKYSRLLTCFSMIAGIYSRRGVVSPADIIGLIQLCPVERLALAARGSRALRRDVAAIERSYARFLSLTGQPEAATLEWIGDKKRRNMEFDEARKFGQQVFQFLIHVAGGANRLRYLVI